MVAGWPPAPAPLPKLGRSGGEGRDSLADGNHSVRKKTREGWFHAHAYHQELDESGNIEGGASEREASACEERCGKVCYRPFPYPLAQPYRHPLFINKRGNV